MRFRLIVWLILFLAGALVGGRYGMPSFITSLTDRGFERIEAWFGVLGEPIPEAEPLEEEAYMDEAYAEDPGEAAPDDGGSAAAPVAASGDVGHPANADLRMNDAGLEIIKESEGLRLEAYNLGGQWLIGYGHSRTARQGMTITEAEAARLLREDVQGAENAVRRTVLVPVNENQFSAMVSLAYNLGEGGFGRSAVLEALNKGDYSDAADAFRKHNKAGGKPNEHLTARREKERALFLTPA